VTLELVFLDVGNADCIVIVPPENQALIIDVPDSGRLYRWLLQRDISYIECIYITHGHRDHLPSLSQLVTFLERWFKKGRGTLGTLYLPTEITRRNSHLNERLKEHNKEKFDLYQSAMDILDSWEQSGQITVARSEHRPSAERHGLVSVRALHPTPLYVDSYSYLHPNRLNDLSLVLRIEYGAFHALFPADIERDGLRNMLARYSDKELHCHVLKIPHHGAWQRDAESTENLFTRANPELAVLSVGSKNTYKHVRPELFRFLIELQQTHRFQRFICTEVTRTCTHTAQERVEMENKGLSSHQPCAGTIVIEAEQSGEWLVRDQEAHNARVDTIERAACRGRADLADEDEVKKQHETG
jgi:beta-lactamase superfamily II metal-dependent hydrolase